MRHYHDRHDEAQPGRQGCDVRRGGELFEPGRGGSGWELAAVGIGVLRFKVARHHDVVADRRIIEAESLAFGNDATHAVRFDQCAGGGSVEADLY